MYLQFLQYEWTRFWTPQLNGSLLTSSIILCNRVTKQPGCTLFVRVFVLKDFSAAVLSLLGNERVFVPFWSISHCAYAQIPFLCACLLFNCHHFLLWMFFKISPRAFSIILCIQFFLTLFPQFCKWRYKLLWHCSSRNPTVCVFTASNHSRSALVSV